MAGRHRVMIWCCLLLGFTAADSQLAVAQPRESSDPIGGITFEPPRRATIRHRAGQLIRGTLLAISPDLVHVRLSSGKEFQYDIKDIRSVVTNDREFRYTTAHDTYREAVEQATGLRGVTIEEIPSGSAGFTTAGMPQPPPPPTPVMLDSPNNYEIAEIVIENQPAANSAAAAQPAQIPAIPQPVPAPQAPAAATVPFYETDGFKIAFLVGCIVVILLWWRNRVG